MQKIILVSPSAKEKFPLVVILRGFIVHSVVCLSVHLINHTSDGIFFWNLKLSTTKRLEYLRQAMLHAFLFLCKDTIYFSGS